MLLATSFELVIATNQLSEKKNRGRCLGFLFVLLWLFNQGID